MTKPSDILDGNLEGLETFFKYFKDNRQKAFENPRNNLLLNGLTFEEIYVTEQLEDLITMKSFFASGSS